MTQALSARTITHIVATALAMAACGQAPPVGSSPAPTGSSGASTGGTGGMAGLGFSGKATTPEGGNGGVGGSSSGSTSSSGSSGAWAGSGASGAAGGAGAGNAGGSAGTAAGAGLSGASGASGASEGLVFSTDPATFGGQPRCQGFDVCESFESTELGGLPPGFTLEGYGDRQVGASADRAMRGARSLKIQITAQSAVTAWLSRTASGTLGARHFGRAFFRIESPAPTEFVHFDLFQGSGPYQGHTNFVRYASTGTGVGTSSSNWSFIYNVQPSGNGAGAEFGTEGDRSAHPRASDWMCLEWSFDAVKQVAQYYLDGVAIPYLRLDDERTEIPVFDSIAVGFGKYQNTGAILVYLDEVAFDGDRIGCNN